MYLHQNMKRKNIPRQVQSERWLSETGVWNYYATAIDAFLALFEALISTFITTKPPSYS